MQTIIDGIDVFRDAVPKAQVLVAAFVSLTRLLDSRMPFLKDGMRPLLPPPGPQTPEEREEEMKVFYLEASIIIEMYLIYAEALHPAISELLAFDATVYVEVACDLYDERLSL
ncbi:hypothetical protein FJT64_007861 [Amphibalanus amphitrite]|uniref:Uncharacterized protein n=1 Tax=Amphibalanus amphitrite TaxID=1232801 RepID=A0A6A4VX86_AMPAM|nr:hypothetical protein FJT64_007861 [Amphibalanus amphitrite]